MLCGDTLYKPDPDQDCKDVAVTFLCDLGEVQLHRKESHSFLMGYKEQS